MSFQFSHEFHNNWLAAPKTAREQIKSDLAAIVSLLKPETNLTTWQKQHGIYHKNTANAEQVSLFDTPDMSAETKQGDTTDKQAIQVNTQVGHGPDETSAASVTGAALLSELESVSTDELASFLDAYLEEKWPEIKENLKQELLQALTRQ